MIHPVSAIHNKLVQIATSLSTWIVVVSILITAFSAFPSWPSALMHLANVPVLFMALWVAHHEGRKRALGNH